MIRATLITLILTLAAPALAPPAMAEVRLGKNVRIGGHDASNQTFTKTKRGEYNITTTAPKNPGCKWRKNKDGSKTKVFNLQKSSDPFRLGLNT
ncbi:hypothetical protein SAMN05216227_101948 [Pseudorhodobacter antarcticus]|uniref:Uncharacterized protein n=1 Tax=Pseudorhodobacter antarcticus TaxID=1077947 RepID=A0A1H8I917_9RHOB|nr:hypothetical protein [Pseudorhodobacter antarcticus]SEN64762.1 hypothetical protein SAMN05216227_101948 [Pseudorhodobacter antarcticus]